MNTAVTGTIGRLLAWTAGIATLIILPSTSDDPVNVPKLLIIAVGGFAVLGILLTQQKILFDPRYRPATILGIAFFLDLLIVLIVSGTNFNQEFFGTYGRATGFVTYSSLTFLLVAAVFVAQPTTLNMVSRTLVITGGASVFYGLLQSLGADPANWVLPLNPVVGFLGNPNFQSSFVGFNGVFVFALILNAKYSLITRFLLFFDLLLSLYVIHATDSQQGFLVLIGGISVVGIIWIRYSQFKILTIPAFVFGTAGAVVVALGSLNSGPLASLLYKASVTYRGDYWRAGWKMSVENPLFGVGLDSYGDWYPRERTIEATLRRGPEIVSNAAHNVFLDFSSNGGFPLVLIYIFILCLVLASSVRVFRRSQSFNPTFTGLFAVWLGYQAQSIISLNQLGLAVWGWIISGLLIGYEINTRSDSHSFTATPKQAKVKSASSIPKQKVSAGVLIAMLTGGIIGLGLGAPPVIASSNYLSAINSKDADLIQQAAFTNPKDATRSAQVALIFIENNLPDRALTVIQDAKRNFPDSYDVWKLLAALSNAPAADVAEAKAQMKRLDPTNPDLK
jgi:O-antigen ligase